MKIHISELTDEGYKGDFTIEAVELNEVLESRWDEHLHFKEKAYAHVAVSKTIDVLEISGSFKAVAENVCARCLDEITVPVGDEFRISKQSGPDDLSGEELSSKDLDLDFLTGDLLDLNTVVLEQLALALPYKMLCKSSCKGLCPKCGQNLNTGECPCKKEAGDSKFSALKGMKLP